MLYIGSWIGDLIRKQTMAMLNTGSTTQGQARYQFVVDGPYN